MACNDVGSTNPDIAGLGVILSFTIQAGLSFCLSLWSVILHRYYDDSAGPSLLLGHHPRQSGDGSAGGSINTLSDLVWRNLQAPFSALLSRRVAELSWEKTLDARLKLELIDRLLKTISDTQTLNGISLLVGAIVQHSTLSLYHYHIVYDAVNFTGVSVAAALAVVLKRPNAIIFRLGLVFVFVILYLAFVILFGQKLQSWDDNISGACYKVDKISARGTAHPYVDIIYLAITALYLFASLGASFQDVLAKLEGLIRGLQNPAAVPDRHVHNPSSSSLGVWAQIYELAFAHSPAASPLLQSLHGEALPQLFRLEAQILDDDPSVTVLIIALAQYPVHIYTLFALRASNEAYLSGDSENQWGFGQVVALVLVASVLLECVRVTVEYRLLKWKRKHSDGMRGRRHETVLNLLRTLLLEEDVESRSGAPIEPPSRLRRQRSLPTDFKYR
ncbi:hypothetical protein F4777DRAFT_559260 [Nemania sp. FL0916]|nr:hypothetical protein F4777DRAFT_559260 [Nemania sp. FL0916]